MYKEFDEAHCPDRGPGRHSIQPLTLGGGTPPHDCLVANPAFPLFFLSFSSAFPPHCDNSYLLVSSLLSSSAHLHSLPFLLLVFLFFPPPSDISSLYFLSLLFFMRSSTFLNFHSPLLYLLHLLVIMILSFCSSSVICFSIHSSTFITFPPLFLLHLIIMIPPFYLCYATFSSAHIHSTFPFCSQFPVIQLTFLNVHYSLLSSSFNSIKSLSIGVFSLSLSFIPIFFARVNQIFTFP